MPSGRKDAALAATLTVLTQIELQLATQVDGPIALQAASFAVMTSAVGWRRVRPLMASAMAGGGLVAQTLAGDAEVVGGFIALLIVTYSVASYTSRNRALLGGLLIVIGVFVYPVMNRTSFADEVGNAVIFFGGWGLGRAVRARQLRAVEAELRIKVVEWDREEALRAVVADERTRIARELHDIVAHGVSIMVLQAGAARQTVDRDREGVKELLGIVEQTGRQALDEMHRLLGVLRRGDEDLALAPPATLAALDALLNDLRRTGLAVHCRVEGEPRALPASLDVSAFRIVQQALTNVVQHAHASCAEVVVGYEPDALRLMILDDGLDETSEGMPDRHGLVGMLERAELFGGAILAGPVAPHGWKVQARLPIGQVT